MLRDGLGSEDSLSWRPNQSWTLLLILPSRMPAQRADFQFVFLAQLPHPWGTRLASGLEQLSFTSNLPSNSRVRVCKHPPPGPWATVLLQKQRFLSDIEPLLSGLNILFDVCSHTCSFSNQHDIVVLSPREAEGFQDSIQSKKTLVWGPFNEAGLVLKTAITMTFWSPWECWKVICGKKLLAC